MKTVKTILGIVDGFDHFISVNKHRMLNYFHFRFHHMYQLCMLLYI